MGLDMKPGTVVGVALLIVLGVARTSAQSCVGDCDNSGAVTADELLTLVNTGLGNTQASACLEGVPSGTEVRVSLIIQGVDNAVNECSPEPSATPTGTVLAFASPTPSPTPTGCSTNGPVQGGSIVVFENLQVSATHNPLLSLRNSSNSLVHASCFYAGATHSTCNVTAFTAVLPRQSSTQWQASVGGGTIPAIPEIPFNGELVCIQVDAAESPISQNSLVGTSQDSEQCPAVATSISGFDTNNGDNALCLGGSAITGSCPTGAEYDGCPTGVDPGRIESCWSQSQFTIVCAAAATVTPSPAPTPTVTPMLPPASLVITSVKSAASGTIGDNITALMTVANQGGSAAGPFSALYYYSSDQTITSSDTFSGEECDFNGLAAGQSITCAGPLTVPSTLVPGVYYLGAILTYAGVTSSTAATHQIFLSAPEVSVRPGTHLGEVKAGIMAADEAAAISDVQRRKTARAAALAEREYGAAHTRLRLYALATQLAFAKHKAKIHPAHTDAAKIDALRRNIARVRIKRQAAGWIAGDFKDPETLQAATGRN